MALVLADRVRETSTSTGTTAITLGGAYTGFQTFLAAIGNSNTTYYTIANVVTGEWEVGIGTYTSAGNTLSRDTVLASSNSGSLVNFSSGSKDVFVTQPSERAVYVNSGNTMVTIPALTATGDSSFTSTGALAISKGTTAQQPGSPATGMMRYNTTTNQFEGYSGSSPSWKSIGGSALSNDTSTSSNLYPVFAAATTGTAENLYTSNAKYLYKPSTGELQASALYATNGIVVNSQTVATSYTIASGTSGMSTGPVTVASGQAVTISSGSRWVVL